MSPLAWIVLLIKPCTLQAEVSGEEDTEDLETLLPGGKVSFIVYFSFVVWSPGFTVLCLKIHIILAKIKIYLNFDAFLTNILKS